jgi:hypothetical protein
MRKEGEHQYLEYVRRKYWVLCRAEKSRMLDQISEYLVCHRKHAVRLMAKKKAGRKANPGKRGRKSMYDCSRFLRGLRLVWEVADYPCSKLLKAAIPEWLPAIERHYGIFESDVREKLLRISPATIDRILKAERGKHPRGKSGTKPGSLLRTEIPLRTDFWDVDRPGFVEADTVAHCGNSIAGDFVWSLSFTDIFSGWTECRATWNKGALGVLAQIEHIQQELPFELLGFDCDNGSEFLNHHLIRYFGEYKQKQKLFTFTRSRPYKKNDNAHIEQKNWSHVRQQFGYGRFPYQELVMPMNELYAGDFSLFRNHFCPTFKLSHKELIKSRQRRVYEPAPKTPYQRLMESPHVPACSKDKLASVHSSVDPVTLKRSIDRKMKEILSLIITLDKATVLYAAA